LITSRGVPDDADDRMGRQTMKITIIPEKCCGSGQCVMNAPAVFDQDENAIVVLLAETPPPEERDNALRAAQICPAQAILIEEV